MPGKQKVSYAGLELEVEPIPGERGIYFTDESPEFLLRIHNTLNKRIKSSGQGAIVWFYGFGSGSPEAVTYGPPITFDVEPKGTIERKIGNKLLGYQGNGTIGIFTAMQEEVIESDNDKERILKLPPMRRNYETLYTFTVMEREFYRKIYEYPTKLTKIMTILTILIAIFTAISLYLLSQ